MGHDNYFPQITCKIRCGKHGTGFLVSKNQIITASHTLTACTEDSLVKITAIFHEYLDYSEEYEVHLVSDLLKGSPIALLQLPKDFGCGINPLCADELTEGDSVKLYGYLGENEDYAESFSFNVRRMLSNNDREENCNTILAPIEERAKSFEGLSGSALIFDDKIVGMLLRQKIENTEAIRVEAVTGLKFRKLLLEQGIDPYVAPFAQIDRQVEPDQKLISISGSVSTSEIDFLMSKQFEPIKKERINGKYIDSWSLLQEFIRYLPESGCSSEKKAEFYYSGALWALCDGYFDISEEYFQQAKKENPNTDTRTYQAKKLMDEDNFAKAGEILQPLDSIAVFNLHLACLLADSGNIPQVGSILSLLQLNGLAPDGQTHRLIAFVAINFDEYITAHEHIDKARVISPNHPELKLYEALVLYWEAMHSVFKNVTHSCFAGYTIKQFYPTNEQHKYLEQAYLLLEKAYTETQSDIQIKAQIVWGLLFVSTLLPGRDPMRWLSYVDEIDFLIPSAIIFRIDWDIKIPDELYRKFISYGVPVKNLGLYAYALMEMHLAFEEYDKAREVFEQYSDEIVHLKGKTKDECELQLLLYCSEYVTARKLLNKLSLQKNDKERYELQILLGGNSKNTKSITNRALLLAKNTQNAIDYLNADKICRKYKKWKSGAENGENWYKNTGQLYALVCQATALYERGDYLHALRIIKKAEANGVVSESLKNCKLNCLVSASQFEDAINLAKTFGDSQSNPKLVVFQAQTHINNGQIDKAKQILQAFADKGRYDLELYTLLVQLIKPNNPDLAFDYAYKLHLQEPENKEFLNFAGMVGIMTGHSEITAKFFSVGMDEKTGWRTITIDEGLKMMQEARISAEENAKLYRQLKTPIHIFADSLSIKNMGGLLCSQWESNDSVYARFGGKDHVNFNRQKSIILDYTALITILRLDIVNYVLEMFDSLWITNTLLAVWLHDVNGLKDVQHHVVERDIMLSDELKKLSFTIYPIFTGDFEEYNEIDVIHLHCAQENNAFIVADSPSGKVFDQPVPDAWYIFQVYPDELYAALQRLKIPHPPYNAERVRSDIVEQLLSKPRIVFDNHELFDMLQADALYMCFEHFSVFMAENIVYSINYKAQEHRERKKNAEWLENRYRVISNLCAQKKISICPIPERDSSNIPQHAIYSNIIKDEFLIAEKRGDNIWFDDRFLSRYEKISGKNHNRGFVVGTLDVLQKMRECEILSENKYYQKLDKLIEANYCFFVPDADYLFSRIILASCDDLGHLIENRQLTSVRRTVARAIQAEYGLSVEAMKDAQYSEISWYSLSTSKVYSKCIICILESSKDEQWKFAALDWLLLTLGDIYGGYSNESKNYANQWSLRLFLLATSSIRIEDKYLPQYSDWLNSYINIALLLNPALIDGVASNIANLFASIGEEEAKSANIDPVVWEKLKSLSIAKILEKLPYNLLKRVLVQPEMSKFNIEIERDNPVNVEQNFQFLESDNVSFTIEDILNCIEDAMEETILIVYSSSIEIGQRILDELSNDRLREVNPDLRYRLSRFFFDLSWYLPCELYCQALEKKRFLALLANQ